MKKFLRNIIRFCIPLLILFLPGILVLYLSEENFHSIDQAIEDDEPYLIGYAFNEDNYMYLKWKAQETNLNKEVMVLGSSRSLQFRKEMFSSSFYNLGFAVSSVLDLDAFYKIDSSHKPDVLILSLDQWMFNENWDNLKYPRKNEDWKNAFTFLPRMRTQYLCLRGLVSGEINLGDLNVKDSVKRIGLHAKINRTGFRNDGSFFEGNQIQCLLKGDSNAVDFAFKETISKVESGRLRFAYGDKVNDDAFMYLKKFIRKCKSEGIHVVVYLPPAADEVHNALDLSGKHQYWSLVGPRCHSELKELDVEFYDFSRLSSFGGTDSEMLDGHHGSEVVYLRMLIKMSQSGSKLNEHCELEKLISDLNSRRNDLMVYPDFSSENSSVNF